MPLPGGVQDQAEQGFEQRGPVGGVLAYTGSLESDDLMGPFQLEPFYDYDFKRRF